MTTTSNFKKVSIGVIAIAIAFGAYFGLTATNVQALTPLDSLSPGDLIRGESYSAVYYYGADGFRYVFPNGKTYDTWYSNFDSVKWISDADLGRVQIGGNVTYKPGIKMIKINSDPKTYAVTKGGVLRHVTTESVAVSLYGSNWNQQIDDVPDGFFSNYTIGTAITDPSEYNPTTEVNNATNIDWDKDLKAPYNISITDNGYNPIDVTINAGESVKWTNNGNAKHTADSEDLSWGSGTINPGESFRKTFDEPGVYPFKDNYDNSNSGAVYVN